MSNLPAYVNNTNIKLSSQIIGFIAGITVILLNIPQIFLMFKNKSSKDISFFTIILNIISGILYLIYGILIYQLPLIICNTLYIIITFIMLYTKNKFNN